MQDIIEISAEYGVNLLQGLGLTLRLVVMSTIAGFVFSLPITYFRLSRKFYKRWPAFAYTFFFRGTPLLVQLFLIYYGLSQFEFIKQSWLWDGVLSDALFCAWLAFSLNASAYMSEILYGSIRQISHRDVEAATAFGMSKWQVLKRIVFPQAWRNALPAYSNEVVLLVKASALASVITLMDLTGQAKTLVNVSFLAFEIYALAGLCYLAINAIIVRLFRLLESRSIPYRQAQISSQGSQVEAEPVGLLYGR